MRLYGRIFLGVNWADTLPLRESAAQLAAQVSSLALIPRPQFAVP